MFDATSATGGVDFIEAGAGDLAVLVHSSMAGARQWSALTLELQQRFRVRAVNLFGYGGTPAWSAARSPSLDDFAELVAQAVPDAERNITLVGHSFGGAVAITAASSHLRDRVKNLVLIEPSLFHLLEQFDRREAFGEMSALEQYTRQCLADGKPEAAAERFIDYWSGPGTWAASPRDRQSSFARLITRLEHEWNAVLNAPTTPLDWTALPDHTLVMAAARTKRPVREIVNVLATIRPAWKFAGIPDGGHMVPLTHPHLVNPVIKDFLR